jgi:hypothetical protein
MPLRVRCDPQLPKTMQREHRDEATDVLPATFLNEAIRHPSCLSPRKQGRTRSTATSSRGPAPPGTQYRLASGDCAATD